MVRRDAEPRLRTVPYQHASQGGPLPARSTAILKTVVQDPTGFEILGQCRAFAKDETSVSYSLRIGRAFRFVHLCQ